MSDEKSTALAPVAMGGAGLPTPAEFDSIAGLAGWIARARMFPQYQSVEQVFTALLYVRDLGVAMMPGMAKGFFVNGKFGVETEVKLAAVTGRMPTFEWEILEQTENRCEVRGRAHRQAGWTHASFSREDASRANLLGKDTYKGYARDMFLWRAVSRLLKVVAGPAIYGMPLAVREALNEEDAVESTAEVVEEQDTAGQRDQSTPAVSTESAGRSGAGPVELPDHKALFVARAAVCGWRGNAKLRDCVNHGMTALGLTPVQSSAAVTKHDWHKLWEWLDGRYDETGKPRGKEAAESETATSGGRVSATGDEPTVSEVASPVAVIESEDVVEVAMPASEPKPDVPEDHLFGWAEMGVPQAILDLATWAAEHKVDNSPWLREHPEGSGRLYFFHGVTLRAAGFLTTQNGKSVAVPKLLSVQPEDPVQVASEDELKALGAALSATVKQLLSLRRTGGTPMPAKAQAALAGARGGAA